MQQNGVVASRISACILAMALIVICAALLFNSFNAVPSADDFIQAAMVKQDGVWGLMQYKLTDINGRFSSNMLLALHHRLFDIIEYNWVGPLNIVIFFLLVWFFFFRKLERLTTTTNSAAHTSLTNIRWWQVATLFLIIYLTLAHTNEIIYWLTGGYIYQHALTLFLLLIALSIGVTVRIDKSTISKGAYYRNLMGLSLLACIISGFNEGIAMLNCATMALGCVWALTHAPQSRRLWICMTVAALIGTVFLIISPGNAGRIMMVESSDDRVRTFLNSITALVKGFFLFHILLMFVMTSVYIIPFTHKILKKYLLQCKLFVLRCSRPFRILLICYYLAIPIFVLLPSIYGLGNIGPRRLHAAIYFITPLTWGLFFAALRCEPIFKRVRALGIRKIIAYAYGVCFIGIFLFGYQISHTTVEAVQEDFMNRVVGTPAHLIADALYKGKRYKNEVYSRFATIQDEVSRGNSHVRIPPLTESSLTLHFEFLTEDIDHWRNNAAEQYFGATSVAVTRY